MDGGTSKLRFHVDTYNLTFLFSFVIKPIIFCPLLQVSLSWSRKIFRILRARRKARLRRRANVSNEEISCAISFISLAFCAKQVNDRPLANLRISRWTSSRFTDDIHNSAGNSVASVEPASNRFPFRIALFFFFLRGTGYLNRYLFFSLSRSLSLFSFLFFNFTRASSSPRSFMRGRVV